MAFTQARVAISSTMRNSHNLLLCVIHTEPSSTFWHTRHWFVDLSKGGRDILAPARVGSWTALFDLLYFFFYIPYYMWIACVVLLQVFKVQFKVFEYLWFVLHCDINLEEVEPQVLLFQGNWIVLSLTRRKHIFSVQIRRKASPLWKHPFPLLSSAVAVC